MNTIVLASGVQLVRTDYMNDIIKPLLIYVLVVLCFYGVIMILSMIRHHQYGYFYSIREFFLDDENQRRYSNKWLNALFLIFATLFLTGVTLLVFIIPMASSTAPNATYAKNSKIIKDYDIAIHMNDFTYHGNTYSYGDTDDGSTAYSLHDLATTPRIGSYIYTGENLSTGQQNDTVKITVDEHYVFRVFKQHNHDANNWTLVEPK